MRCQFNLQGTELIPRSQFHLASKIWATMALAEARQFSPLTSSAGCWAVACFAAQYEQALIGSPLLCHELNNNYIYPSLNQKQMTA
jgi:hypothetical protein